MSFAMHELSPPSAIPARAGIGLKARHISQVLADRPDVGWFEVHAENYMGAGGPFHRQLEQVRADYPLSIHGVGLSLGGAGPLDFGHLERLAAVTARYAPGLVSEHLAWAAHGHVFFNDLLPLPYTEETLAQFCRHINQTQERLGRFILVENPSTYLVPKGSEMDELTFLTAACVRTGCDLLFDVNNLFVTASNHGLDAEAWLDSIPAGLVREIHLAGHAVDSAGGETIRVDDHGSHVCAEVWALYERLIARIGPRPTLIEWDTNVPELGVLLEEAARAEAVLNRYRPQAKLPEAAYA
ncbi:MAG: DUF692 family multinuclear iron-containing protein [Alphaproteobacteria bacterium]